MEGSAPARRCFLEAAHVANILPSRPEQTWPFLYRKVFSLPPVRAGQNKLNLTASRSVILGNFVR
jgi:hypothetical protein